MTDGQAGVNHIDVAASYGDAEDRLRPGLSRAPGQFFLATKTGEREAGKARQELERSLERMGVDHVDLWQLHNLVDPIEWDVALSPGGALEAAVAAREEGLTRFIGVTGHGLQVAGYAPALAGAVRLRFGTPALQLRDCAGQLLLRKLRSPGGHVQANATRRYRQ